MMRRRGGLRVCGDGGSFASGRWRQRGVWAKYIGWILGQGAIRLL